MTTTHLKSLLFVPGDSEKKMLKGISTQASALILDLEDSVTSQNLDKARSLVREFLTSRVDRTQQLWVRINSLASPYAIQDLAHVVAGKPDGILLPKTESARDVNLLCNYLTALEVRDGLPPGCVRIIPVSTETPASLFELGSYKESSKRLVGMTWGAEDLATALGASTNRNALGDYDFTYCLARSLALAGAYSAGVQAIDTISADFRSIDALMERSRRRDALVSPANSLSIPNKLRSSMQAFCPVPKRSSMHEP